MCLVPPSTYEQGHPMHQALGIREAYQLDQCPSKEINSVASQLQQPT